MKKVLSFNHQGSGVYKWTSGIQRHIVALNAVNLYRIELLKEQRMTESLDVSFLQILKFRKFLTPFLKSKKSANFEIHKNRKSNQVTYVVTMRPEK